jgi:hypothetical protein
MPRQTTAALGFRAHTGWAAVVVAARECDVLERRRIVYEPSSTRFVYHKAAEIALNGAETLITTARAEAVTAAEREIRTMIAELARNGVSIRRACVPAGNSKLPSTLSAILAAHSRIHAAEGAFYRDVLVDACTLLGLRVNRAPERDLWPLAAATLASTEGELGARFQDIGKRLGPPWSEDQKLATLAALVALK